MSIEGGYGLGLFHGCAVRGTTRVDARVRARRGLSLRDAGSRSRADPRRDEAPPRTGEGAGPLGRAFAAGLGRHGIWSSEARPHARDSRSVDVRTRRLWQ